MLSPPAPPKSAIAKWEAPAPPFRLSTRVPCTALVLAVTPKVTVPGADEITWQVTFGPALLHVVYSGALLAGTLCVIWTSCPVFCTIPLPVTDVTWKVVTCVESVNVAPPLCPPPVAVICNGKLPPGVAVELENTRGFPGQGISGTDGAFPDFPAVEI
jgi:hypothetical protein